MQLNSNRGTTVDRDPFTRVPLEGQIHIRMPRNGASSPVVRSQRPLAASRILQGKSCSQILEIIPLLYNVCGMAQGCAASAAIEAASGQPAAPETQWARELLVLAENAREHLARIFMDWPGLFALEIDPAALPWLGQAIPAFRRALFDGEGPFLPGVHATPDRETLEREIDRLEALLETQVFGMPPAQWDGMRDIQEMIDWYQAEQGIAARTVGRICEQGWASQGSAECTALPRLPAASLAARLAGKQADDFVARPEWQGHPCESNSYTRQYDHPLITRLREEFGNGLLTRWMARLVELADIPARMRRASAGGTMLQQSARVGSAIGIGLVEAARGRLCHWVALHGEGIAAYRILAPTEWNFHPRGLITRSLANIQARSDEERLRIARLIINAIDPCVQCTLELDDA